jgi:catechol 2,3-dioxygenase-like lactoylglutathione lyase family enzyme
MSNYQFDHIHLNSPDPLKTAQFYETMFGARRVATGQIDVGTVVWLDLHGQTLLITPPIGRPPLKLGAVQPQYGLVHFGLRTDNIEKAVDDLKAKGVTFVQDITPLTPGTSKIAYLLAPEGVFIELQQN